MKNKNEIVISKLENDLRVITITNHKIENINVYLYANIGSRHESYPYIGISHFIEHMVFKGSKKIDAAKLSILTDIMGGNFNAYTSKEHTNFYNRITKNDLSGFLDILKEIFLQPKFDQQDFENEKGVILQEIDESIDSPTDFIFDQHQQSIFPDQTIGYPILGYKKTVEQLTPQILIDYYTQYYTGKNMVLAAVGNIEHNTLLEQAQSFSKFPAGNLPEVKKAEYKRSIKFINKNIEQLHVLISFPAFSYRSELKYKQSILSLLLGGGTSSRLYQEIREKRGLVYSIHCHISKYQDTGNLYIYAITDIDKIEQLLQLVFKELESIKNELISTTEFNKTIKHATNSLLLSSDEHSNIGEMNIQDIIHYGKVVTIEERIKAIKSITLEGLKDIANQILKLDKMSVTLLGKEKDSFSLEKCLEKYTTTI